MKWPKSEDFFRGGGQYGGGASHFLQKGLADLHMESLFKRKKWIRI